jgi:exodeoxyribonuclease III
VRIVTWNVNGLRAVFAKGAWQTLVAGVPDVVCLQEIKVRPDQLAEQVLLQFGDYQAWWNPAARPGYSGVATFSRHQPLDVQLGMGISEFDNEGRLILTRFPGFSLFNVYFPNGQRDHGRLTYKLDFYHHLLELCDRLHAQGERVIICGDFNTAHREIDLRNPKQNEKTSGFLPEERLWIDKYLAHGFVDAYRALYPERVGYTWWTYRMGARRRDIGWRLDYFLVSEQLMPCVQDVIIHKDVEGSDHCPVTLVIEPDV